MRAFKLLLLPLVCLNLLYANLETIKIPKNIETKLCKKLSDKGCNYQQQLESSHYFNLSKNKTLFFFHLYQKNGLYTHGYANVPAIVDNKGRWTVVNKIIDAEIQEVVQDPNGGIWLRALWMIEGVSPSLYYSKDAITWRAVTFPDNRPSAGAFEDLRLCLLEKTIELTFSSLDNDESDRTWSASYSVAMNKHPQWRALNYKKNCSHLPADNNDTWSLKKSKNGLNLVFKAMEAPKEIMLEDDVTPSSNASNSTLSIDSSVVTPMQPTATRNITYTIQLGTFNHKESLDVMVKNMEPLKERLISKELTIDATKKHKLFLGSFSNRKEAQAELTRLKKSYTKNKKLQGAFVTKFP